MALPDMVFVIDRDGHYVDFNESSGQEAIVDPTEFISKKYPTYCLAILLWK